MSGKRQDRAINRLAIISVVAVLSACATTTGADLLVNGTRSGSATLAPFEYQIKEVGGKQVALQVSNVTDTMATFDPSSYILVSGDEQFTAWDRAQLCEMVSAYTAAMTGAAAGISIESCNLEDDQRAGPILPGKTVLKRVYFDETPIPFTLMQGADTVMVVRGS